MSDPTRICDACGKTLPADAPEGLCPECLLKQALAGGDSGTESEAAIVDSGEGIALADIAAVEESP